MPLPQRLPTFLSFIPVLFCLALCPPLLHAQDEDDVVRVSTELVVLNITVTDKAGQYVPGLKMSDFKIFEDGKQVPAELISSFSMHESPFASVVLLDTSGSMETRLSLARSAAIRFLDRLRIEDVAAVFKFDSKVEQVQEFSGGRDLAPMAFGMRAKGMTKLNDAIVDAAKALAEREEKRKAIVVLSDGLDTNSDASSDKALESALAIGATIYTVDMSATEGQGFRNQQSAGILKSFAEKSGGRFVATPGGPALRDAFANIADELGHQYTVAYRPLNRAHDGKWRKLEVKTSREDLVVRSRKSYRAPKK
ncbi:MAG TPA: VWA domain-containing protein [Pyrinomonadaceae bacterium]|nr:VWA domain-containing protein [Pyrinomonadaceae bacterium]